MNSLVGVPVVQRLRRYIGEDHTDTYVAEEIAPVPGAERRDVATVISIGIDLIHAYIGCAALLGVAVDGKTGAGVDLLRIGAGYGIASSQNPNDKASAAQAKICKSMLLHNHCPIFFYSPQFGSELGPI